MLNNWELAVMAAAVKQQQDSQSELASSSGLEHCTKQAADAWPAYAQLGLAL
jgi:hypothetical protein